MMTSSGVFSLGGGDSVTSAGVFSDGRFLHRGRSSDDGRFDDVGDFSDEGDDGHFDDLGDFVDEGDHGHDLGDFLAGRLTLVLPQAGTQHPTQRRLVRLSQLELLSVTSSQTRMNVVITIINTISLKAWGDMVLSVIAFLLYTPKMITNILEESYSTRTLYRPTCPTSSSLGRNRTRGSRAISTMNRNRLLTVKQDQLSSCNFITKFFFKGCYQNNSPY